MRAYSTEAYTKSGMNNKVFAAVATIFRIYFGQSPLSTELDSTCNAWATYILATTTTTAINTTKP